MPPKPEKFCLKERDKMYQLVRYYADGTKKVTNFRDNDEGFMLACHGFDTFVDFYNKSTNKKYLSCMVLKKDGHELNRFDSAQMGLFDDVRNT